MVETEIAVKKSPEKETQAVSKLPGFDFPFFRGDFVNTNPFTMMRVFARDVDRFFSEMPYMETGSWFPAVEVKQDGGKLLVTAELPGLKKDDVKVQVTEDSVILEGERKQEKEQKREGFYHSERSYGRFYRSIPLPKGADADKATAEYVNGVLEIKIPVPEAKPKAHVIPVKGAA
jgi:HSP20 family protein